MAERVCRVLQIQSPPVQLLTLPPGALLRQGPSTGALQFPWLLQTRHGVGFHGVVPAPARRDRRTS